MAIGPNNKRPRKFSAPKHSATAKSSKLAKRQADFNASGYAKRQQRKASKKVGGGVEDVYDYRQDKVRRANVRLQLDKDEEAEFGAGSDEDEDEDAEGGGSGGKKRPRLIGEIDDDERIASEDDEEIDSDAAFEESDEERFAGFDFGKRAKEKKEKAKGTKRKTNGPSVRFAEVDLNEDVEEDDATKAKALEKEDNSDEESEEEGEPGDFIDVLDVLDGRGEPYMSDDETSRPTAEEGPSRKTRAEEDEDIEVDVDAGEGDNNDDENEDEEENEDDEDVEKDEDSDIISASEEEDADPDALDKLGAFVSSLETNSKRKAGEEDDSLLPSKDELSKTKKRKLLPERTESGLESEFGAKLAGSSKLTLDDLLAPLSTHSSNLSNLKKSTKALAPTSSGKNKPLAAPLPQRTQEKLDREAAYEQTKEETDKWNETMKRIREAEHLSFPLQPKKVGNTSNMELTAKFKPTTEMESSIDALLKSAKMRESDIVKEETLKMNHLSESEVRERHAQLSKMRELMFRAEAKAKRVAKIKSKTYRRIKKKEKEKLDKLLNGEDGEGDDEEDEEARRMKAEMERARERATLRHKNTGKWARAMRERDGLGEEERRDVGEMLERGERLRRRIHGIASGSEEEEEDDSGDDDGDDGGEGGIGKIRAGAFDELRKLSNNVEDGAEDPSKKKKPTIFDMKFMKEAEARQSRVVDKDIDDFKLELGRLGGGGDGEGIDVEDVGDAPGEDLTQPSIERVGGRMVFRPGPLTNQYKDSSQLSDISTLTSVQYSDVSTLKSEKSPLEHNGGVASIVSANAQLDAEDADPDVIMLSASGFATSKRTKGGRNVSLSHAGQTQDDEDDSANPWLDHIASSTAPASGSKISRKKNTLLVSKGASAVDKSLDALKKRKEKGEDEKEKRVEDARVEIDLGDAMVAGEAEVEEKKGEKGEKKRKERHSKKGKAAQPQGPASAAKSKPSTKQLKSSLQDSQDAVNSDSDANSELEAQERYLSTKGKKRAAVVFEQRELVARAFAGDDVVQEFMEEKRREEEEDRPKVVDLSVPGWGSWIGQGLKQRPKPTSNSKSKSKRQTTIITPGITPTSRTDANKSHVIISEKKDKKAEKYLVRELPYPYTSKEQFVRSMEVRVGSEWVTRVARQRGTMPGVVKKMGTVIEPLERLF